MPQMKALSSMHAANLRLAIVAATLLAAASGFGTIPRVVSRHHSGNSRRCARSALPSASPDHGAHAAESDGDSDSDRDGGFQLNRRQWIASQLVVPSAILISGTANDANAEVTPPLGDAAAINNASRIVPKSKSVVVLGANGGTGKECVSAILASGRPCVATTRSGAFNYDEDDASSILRPSNPDLQQGRADVAQLDSLFSLVDEVGSERIGAVIFAASASAKGKTPGNDAFAVDRQGVINAARCCIQRGIPRLVIVSSGAVTRPNSPVYKLLNFVGGGIMEAKIQGEDAVREMYRDDKLAMERGLGYTVVRPGGLTVGPPLGPASLEVNQGDDKSGRLSRADVAGICVACLESESAFDATFECYESDTAKPVDNVGLSNILRSTDPTSFKSGKEGRGETWDALLGGLKSDF